MWWEWPQLLVAAFLVIRVVFCVVRDGKEMKLDGGATAAATAVLGAALYAGGFWRIP
jgi:hypothetical protein